MSRTYACCSLFLLTLACGPNGSTSSDTDPTTTDPTTGPTTDPTTGPTTTDPTGPTTTDPGATETTTDPTEATMTGCERVAGGGGLAWSLRCGGPSRDEVRDVSVDAAGNIYVGLEIRPADLDAQMGEPFHIGDFEITPGELSDIVVVKLDSAGEVLWVKHFTGPGDQYPENVRSCGDGVVITGSAPPGTLDFGGGPITEEKFIVALDGDGEQRWSRGVPILVQDGHLTVADIACDADLNVAITGQYRGGIDLGGGPIMAPALYDGITARFDAQGALLWSRGFESTEGSYPTGRGIAYAPDGAVVIIGSFDSSVDLGGGPLKATGGEDVIVAKLDAAGQHVWSQQLGSDGLQYGSRVSVDGTGKVAAGGTFLEGISIGPDSYVNTFPDAIEEVDGTLYDGFLAYFDGAGMTLSSVQIGSKLDDAVLDLEFDADGVLVVTAHTDESLVVQAFVDGEPGWKWSTKALWGSYSAVTKDAVVLGTSYTAELDLGAGLMAGRGESDMVVAKVLR